MKKQVLIAANPFDGASRRGGPRRFFAADATARFMKRFLTLDTHMDTPMNFGRPGWDIMDEHSIAGDLSQIDYPRHGERGTRMAAFFFAIYTPQGPRTPEGFAAARNAAALKRAVGKSVRWLCGTSTNSSLACVPTMRARIAASGKRIVFESIENSYPLGKGPVAPADILRSWRADGRAGAIFTNNDLADFLDRPQRPGVATDFRLLGKEFVVESQPARHHSRRVPCVR